MSQGALDAPSLEQHEVVEQARGLDGATDVRLYLLEAYRVHIRRLSAWVQEKLTAWDRARREPSDP